jgi:hypothetical protein
MAFYQSMNVADSTSMLTNGSTVTAGIIFWPDSSNDNTASIEKSIEWPKETSTASDNTNTSDSAMMLTQGLAAGAALLAALSF